MECFWEMNIYWLGAVDDLVVSTALWLTGKWDLLCCLPVSIAWNWSRDWRMQKLHSDIIRHSRTELWQRPFLLAPELLWKRGREHVSVFSCCCHEGPCICWFQTTQIYYLSVCRVEVWLESHWAQIKAPAGPHFLVKDLEQTAEVSSGFFWLGNTVYIWHWSLLLCGSSCLWTLYAFFELHGHGWSSLPCSWILVITLSIPGKLRIISFHGQLAFWTTEYCEGAQGAAAECVIHNSEHGHHLELIGKAEWTLRVLTEGCTQGLQGEQESTGHRIHNVIYNGHPRSHIQRECRKSVHHTKA